MRISKKFAGQCIGKLVFTRKANKSNFPNSELGKHEETEPLHLTSLKQAEARYFQSCKNQPHGRRRTGSSTSRSSTGMNLVETVNVSSNNSSGGSDQCSISEIDKLNGRDLNKASKLAFMYSNTRCNHSFDQFPCYSSGDSVESTDGFNFDWSLTFSSPSVSQVHYNPPHFRIESFVDHPTNSATNSPASEMSQVTPRGSDVDHEDGNLWTQLLFGGHDEGPSLPMWI